VSCRWIAARASTGTRHPGNIYSGAGEIYFDPVAPNDINLGNRDHLIPTPSKSLKTVSTLKPLKLQSKLAHRIWGLPLLPFGTCWLRPEGNLTNILSTLPVGLFQRSIPHRFLGGFSYHPAGRKPEARIPAAVFI